MDSVPWSQDRVVELGIRILFKFNISVKMANVHRPPSRYEIPFNFQGGVVFRFLENVYLKGVVRSFATMGCV